MSSIGTKEVDMMYGMYHIRRATKKRGDKTYIAYQLRRTVYFKDTGSTKAEYICSLGSQAIIGETALKELCLKHDLDIEQIKSLERLTIVPDDQYQKPRRGRPSKKNGGERDTKDNT